MARSNRRVRVRLLLSLVLSSIVLIFLAIACVVLDARVDAVAVSLSSQHLASDTLGAIRRDLRNAQLALVNLLLEQSDWDARSTQIRLSTKNITGRTQEFAASHPDTQHTLIERADAWMRDVERSLLPQEEPPPSAVLLNEDLLAFQEELDRLLETSARVAMAEDEHLRALRSVQKGAYVSALFLFFLLASWTWALRFRRATDEHVQEARRVQQTALEKAEERYHLLFDCSPLPKWVFDAETLRFLAVNDAAIAFYGYSREELLTMSLPDLKAPEDVPDALKQIRESRDGISRVGVKRQRRKDGSIVETEVVANYTMFEGRRVVLASLRDVTQARILEAQLQQSQKMEAIGRLAGGVAHDFNNMLTIILGYVSMILDDLPQSHPLYPALAEIHRAGVRSEDLARQLLTFSRQERVEPRVVDIRETVGEMFRLLERVVGEDIELTMTPASARCVTIVEAGQVEQILMNLVVNARDAMPDGGKLTIATNVVTLNAVEAARLGKVAAGSYVVLSVNDTGVGMDRETQERMFEPFFTTKEQGKGTGLGLSTVFGIVERCGGHIQVESNVRKGTTFRLYFPQSNETVCAPAAKRTGSGQTRVRRTILLVEDEEQVRNFVSTLLTRKGYEVLSAKNGKDAIQVSEKHAKPIDLLLTDVIMPSMNGRELADELTRQRPDMRVLYMSGYTQDVHLHDEDDAAPLSFLAKPIKQDVLYAKVNDILLDASRSASPGAIKEDRR